jgi:valyl-tRNA synthetase
MRLLHPFAPYVTEEIWQKLPKPPELPGSLMITVFPKGDQGFVDARAESEIALVQSLVSTARMLKNTYGLGDKQMLDIEVRAGNDTTRRSIEQFRDSIERLARVRMTVVASGGPVPGAAKAVVGADLEIVMPLGGLIDAKKEADRIKKSIAKSEKELATIEKKLANVDFVAKAPEDVVAENRERLRLEGEMVQRLKDALSTLDVVAVS